MSRWFNRKKDPHNTEELMISEYQRLIQDAYNYQDKIEALHMQLERQEVLHTAALLDKENTIQQLNDKLNKIISDESGVVDLHEPTELWRITMADVYDLKNYDILGDSYEERLKTANKLMDMHSNERFINNAESCNDRYHKLLVIEKRTFPYTLSINTGSQILKMYYDPEESVDRLIKPKTVPACSSWFLAPYDACVKFATIELRRRLNEAISLLEAKLKEEANE